MRGMMYELLIMKEDAYQYMIKKLMDIIQKKIQYRLVLRMNLPVVQGIALVDFIVCDE